jgi:hypothetical protein
MSYGLEDRDSIFGMGRNSSVFRSLKTAYVPHPASCPLCSGDKTAGEVK